MTDKKLSVVEGNREALEKKKAEEILKALLVDKNRDAAFEIAEELAPRGELSIAEVKQRKPSSEK